MHSIAVAGHLCLDLVPGLPGTAPVEPGSLVQVGPLRIELGGSVANTGGALAALGAAVTPYATIGDDELGRIVVSGLAAAGFANPRLSVSPSLGTSYSIVIEQSDADRTFWHHTGANEEFDGTTVDLADVGILHVGYPNLLPRVLADDGRPLRELLARARASGVTTSIDLAVVDPASDVARLDWKSLLEGVFALTDIASPSMDDLSSALGIDEPYSPELIDRLTEWMLRAGVAVVALSAGRHGVRVRTATAERLRQGGAALAPLADAWADVDLVVTPHPVDTRRTTNGAGDASTAGLLFGLATGASVQDAASLASASAAAVMSGAAPTPTGVAAIDPSLAGLFVCGSIA